MSEEGIKKLADIRSRQPLEELERKRDKAKGRHSNAYWMQEQLDVAAHEGRKLAKFFQGGPFWD